MNTQNRTTWLKRSGIAVLFCVLFLILYVLSALSGLRFFIPHYLTVAGTPFDSKAYLIVLQNNNELRPSGGKIMAYGSVTFVNGLFNDIQVNTLGDTITDHEYVEPPYPMESYTFWDANYDPDFAQTVDNLLAMYKKADSNATFDGVIALNVSVLKDILTITGDIEVGGQNVNAKTIFPILEEGDSETLRTVSKSVIAKSFRSIMSWRRLSDTLVKNLNEKHIQLYSLDTRFQEKLAKKEWSGTWPHLEHGDFFATTEANLSGKQINNYISRSVDYRTYICDKENEESCDHESTMAYTIEHVDRSDGATAYEGYIRFYFPKQTTLTRSNAYINYEGHPHYTVIGTVIRLQPGERKTIEMMLEPPSSIISDNTYHLFVPKQAGTDGDPYSIIVETPRHKTIQSSTFSIQENIAKWQGALQVDKALSLRLTDTSL